MRKFQFRNGCMVETIWRDTVTEAWASLCARWPNNWRDFVAC